MLYAQTKAIDSGATKAQIFVGRRSLVVDIFPVKSDKWFVRRLWDVIRKRGAMDTLMSDSAKVQISEKVKDILRYMCIKDWQSEPGFQHQNFCERRYQNVKHNTQNLMNKMNLPGFMWLLTITYVAFVMNHTAVESLDWRTPIEVLTGNTPDISPILQFKFFEDVYYADLTASNTIGADDEKAGWFVGFAENVGHSMTYKVLCKESLMVLHKSCLRRATEGRNKRADERAAIYLASRGFAPNGLTLTPSSDPGEPLTIKHTAFAFIDSDRAAHNAPMPTFDPHSLIGRSYLTFPDEDNQRLRARIVGVSGEDSTTVNPAPGDPPDHRSHPDVLKLRCIIGQGEKSYEELVDYNEIMNLLEEENDPAKTGLWQFEEIIDHEGPLRKGMPRWDHCMWNVKVRWSDGSETWQPLSWMKNSDPVTLALYGEQHGLLDTHGWKTLKRWVKNKKQTLRYVNQAKLRSFRTSPVYKYGFQVPRNHAEAVRIDTENGNTKWQDAEAMELAQIDEYETFDDRGETRTPPEGYKKIRVHMVYDIKHDGRHKARLVADGQLTEVPLDSVYSSVVSLRAIRMVTFLAELNDLDLWGTDVGNAYLESYTKEKLYIIAGDEFGDRKGHLLVIVRAIYGLRSSGARWHDRFFDVLKEMGWTPCKLEKDVWLKRVGDHYEYIATYVDDLLIASKNPKAITDELMERFKFKLKGTGPLTFHLGCDYFRDEEGTLCVSPRKYIGRFLDSFKRLFGHEPCKKYKSPLEPNDHPELDTSDELPMEDIKVYQSLIGGFQWSVSLGRADMAVSVNTMSTFRTAPRQGHLHRLKRMCGYLAAHKSAAIRIRTEKPDYSAIPIPEYDWERIYEGNEEAIPDDIPVPLGKSVITTTYIDANLQHCLATGRAITGIMHLLNKTPIDTFSKKQTTVETATYGSEFAAARVAVDQVIDIRNTLRYLGVPIDGRAYMFGDNESVVTSSTVPHSKLNKRHNALSYHRVREAIAAKIAVFTHIPGEINPADILSKHWMHCKIWKMLQAVLFWPGDTAELLDESVGTASKAE